MEINYNQIFSNLDTFTRLPLVLKGRKWYGRCYLDGSEHTRWDKVVGYMKKDKIYLLEQGGDVLSLWDWMLQYGGCRDNKEVSQKLLGDNGIDFQRPIREYKEPKLRYVYPNVMENTLCEYRDNLFLWLLKHFNKSEVLRVLREYKVGNLATKRGIMTIFWYIDKEDRVCFDKKMLYNEDGHRNKDYGGGRKYKVDLGFRGKCYFGEHLIKEDSRVFVVESEKTAIIMSLFDKRKDVVYIACGGVQRLGKVEQGWKLLRDYDKAGEMWEGRGECVKWWEKYENVQEGWDIGDMVIQKIENLQKLKKDLGI